VLLIKVQNIRYLEKLDQWLRPVTISKITASQPNSIKIEVTDLYLNSKTTYNSTGEAARALNIAQSRISMYFNRNQKKPLNGRYVFRKL
jgi:hypothetical protein